MKKILLLVVSLACLLPIAALAQTGTSQTTNALKTEITGTGPGGLGSGQTPPISAAKLRQALIDMSVSYLNVYSADGFAGIDCTGVGDSTTGLQNAINAIPDNSMLHFPANCTVILSSTITITNRVGLILASDMRQQGVNSPPSFIWAGSGTVNFMFDIEHSDHPTFRGFHFGTISGILNRFLNFDGNPGGQHVGTLATVEFSDFDGSAQTNNANFVAVAISDTATQNHEKYYIHDITIRCGSAGAASNRATDAVLNSTTTVTSATAAFVGGDVGKRIRLSSPGYFQDTTISAVNSGANITLAVAATVTQSNVQLTIGTYYGIGIYNGVSANAKHQRFYNNQILNCETAIYMGGGSGDIRHLGGGFGARGIYINAPTNDEIFIEGYDSENDFRGIEVGATVAPVIITGSRLTNANQFADGFYKFGGGDIILQATGQISAACGTNANSVVVGTGAGSVNLTSMGNQFQCSFAQVGYSRLTSLISMNDIFSGSVTPFYVKGLPTVDPHVIGQLWNNGGVLTVSAG